MNFLKLFSLTLLLIINSTLSAQAQIYGCTDPLANNYNSSANLNDGSCLYNTTSIVPSSSMTLPAIINETSGLLISGDSAWTHNDNSDIRLYRFSLNDTSGIQQFPVIGSSNIDWEDITSDSNYFYVGDFGNNLNGARTNLQILRINKQSLLAGQAIVDTIKFSYSDQNPVTPVGANATDFDCEAMIADQDSIYLFSKMWTSQKTTVYSVSKNPGTHVAVRKFQINVQGLITGASLNDTSRVIALCGYSTTLQPFIYLLYDFTGTDFHLGNKRKLNINLSFHQIEGIASSDGLNYYCSNERFTQSVVSISPKLHKFNLGPYLSNYLITKTKSNAMKLASQNIVYPNPFNEQITFTVDDNQIGARYILHDLFGKEISSGNIDRMEMKIQTHNLAKGLYFLRIIGSNDITHKVIKSN
jgi:hypothetical protein